MYEYKEFNEFVKLNRYLYFDKASVEIPSEINGKPVTRIGDECFYNHPEIKEIQFTTSLERIGNNAFEKCSGIEKLILPSSVTYIGINAFRECTSLKKVILSPNLKVLNQGVFSYCQLVRVKFTIPEGLQEIRESAFFRSGYFELILPKSVKKIGMGAFCYGPKVKTDLEQNDAWYVMWPYRESVRLKDGIYGEVTDYALLSDKCSVLTLNVKGEVKQLFFPSVENDYQFFWNRSQDRMKEYVIDGEVKSYYEAWLSGTLEIESFYQKGELERTETTRQRDRSLLLEKKNDKQNDTMPSDFEGVFEKYKDESPEKVLVEMQLFILAAAESFRNGEITEEEFFVKTFVDIDLLNKVIELKDNTTINYYYYATQKDKSQLVAAWKKWKETGEVGYHQWMIRTINTTGNVIEATKWAFHVIDVLLYPIGRFISLDTKLYKVPVLYCYSGNNGTMVHLMIDDYLILDTVPKFDELFKVGESYHLRYRSGIEVDIKITGFSDIVYEGEGIIHGYMTCKQKMLIYEIENRIRILFNKRTFSKYSVTMGTAFNPIPHPDWNLYNKAHLEWSYQREAEYKSLRLPYMLGMITKEQILSQLTDNKTGKLKNKACIIDISDMINKNEDK